MKNNPFIVIGIVFIAGIILGNYFPNYSFLSSGLLFFTVLYYIFLIKTEKSSSTNKSLCLLVIVSCLSYLNYTLTLPENQVHNLAKNYLKGDQLIGTIDNYSPTKGAYIKCEFSTKKLIRFNDTIPTSGKIIVFLKDPKNLLKQADVCVLNTDLVPIVNKNNPGEFDAENFWKHKGFQYLAFADEGMYAKLGETNRLWTAIFDDLRNYFSAVLEQRLTGDELGVAKALILGDRSSLDAEITNKFGNTGAMHVLAVSGLHVGILVQILTLILSVFNRWISKNQALVFALVIVWIYSLLTGFSASVVRSAVMFTILSGSTLLGRNYLNYNSLFFSVVLILAWNPHFLYDIGFQLSYLAMLGIFMFYKPLSKVIVSKYKVVRQIIEGTMVGIAAQIMTVPLTLYYFHQFPNYFIITNIGLMIFSFLILALGLALFSFSWIKIFGKFLAWTLSISLTVMLVIISVIDALPGAVAFGFELSPLAVLILFVLIFIFYVAFIYEKMKWLLISLSVTLVFVIVLVVVRYQNLNQNQVSFFQADEVSFVIKLKDKLIVCYGNKDKNLKQISFLAKNYQKLYPGEISYHEISTVKRTDIKSASSKIKIERQKGGYEIELNDKRFFYVTNLNNKSNVTQKVYASWIDINETNSLKSKACTFSL